MKPSTLVGACLITLTSTLAVQGNLRAQRLAVLTEEQREILELLSLVYLDDGSGGAVNKTIRVTGANLQVVNGLDDTESANGVGNIIVGYNELGGSTGVRTGSHCVVVGRELDYSSYGGQVLGVQNEISDAYASVFGGRRHAAVGPYAVISGGAFSYVQGDAASVFGGYNNFASGPWSTVAGGHINNAFGSESTVSGGWLNIASGTFSSISGGKQNTASGYVSSVGGGSGNQASHEYATVGGGCSNSTGSACEFLP